LTNYRIKGTGPVRAHFLGKYIVGYARYMQFKQYLNTITHNKIVQKRLEIVNFFERFGKEATKEAFGYSKTEVYRWRKLYRDSKYNPDVLIPRSKRPRHTRRMVVDERILSFIRNLREHNYRLGKEKIKPLLDMYCESEGVVKISESLIGKIIKRNNLFLRPSTYTYRNFQSNVFRAKSRRVVRSRLSREFKSKISGDLIQIDTVVRFDLGTKRYILTAIDLFSRFSFAFAYTRLNSQVSLDFFKKLQMVIPFSIKAVKTDNGLEFLGDFDAYLTSKGITHYFSYPRTPKSNAFIERFNRTIQEEFVDNNLEYFKDTEVFNTKLMDYLVYYNQVRPHKSLKNQTPMGYLVTKELVSVMSVTSTKNPFVTI